MNYRTKTLNILRGCFFATIAFSFSACLVMEGKYSAVAPGTWRGTIQMVPKEIVAQQGNEIHTVRELLTQKDKKTLPDAVRLTESTEGELPFLFDVKYLTDTTFEIDIINGEERIKVEAADIKHGRNRQTGRDTLRIDFPVFGSYIKALYQERVMDGEWIIPAKGLTYKFNAHFGQNHRFTTLAKPPKADLTGKWDCDFDLANKKPYKAIGELRQNGNILRGTFRTETGDYRYLDGEVQGDKFYLSTFDGAHAFIFEGKIREDGHLDGTFRSGRETPEVWEARKNDATELRNANELTVAKSENSINFTFPNAEGKMVSLADYGQKVKILQIMGTWCPNCWDETRFLTQYLKENPSEKLAIVALSFERNPDIATTQVSVYKKKMNLPYEILIAGTSTKKEEAAKALPFMSEVLSYPTMVFVDKNNKIRRIHTGFDGPATSKYADFKKEFEEFTKKLMSE
jgi:thiol-disulfide isomerase/thioredoxin